MKSITKALKKWLVPSDEDQEIIYENKKAVAHKEEEKKKNKKAPRVFMVMNYHEAQDIAHHLFIEQPAIVNVSNLLTKDKYRVIDFLSGVIYVLDGERVKLDKNIYLFTLEKSRKTTTIKKD